MLKKLKSRIIVIRGAGEMATGVACRLYRANFKRILMLETPSPMAIRRYVSFSEAVYDRRSCVEGVEAEKIERAEEIEKIWDKNKIAILVDPKAQILPHLKPDVFIDATLAKRNLGTSLHHAPLVIALGPGFSAGTDCHVVVETNRGHHLGRLIPDGPAAPNTGIPGNIGGYTIERVLRAPADGTFVAKREIGDLVLKDEVIGKVNGANVRANINGVLRGLIRFGFEVKKGLKIGDIDPRGEKEYCFTISEKARAIGGTVLESILSAYNV
jgi:xanthine dehydrogenase accessory factor